MFTLKKRLRTSLRARVNYTTITLSWVILYRELSLPVYGVIISETFL